MRPIHTNLPAPTGGMLLAKRPTGIIMAFVVLLLANIAMSVPKLTEVIIAAVNAVRSGEAFTAADYVGFDREGGVLAVFSFALATGFVWFWMAVKERRRFATIGFTSPREGLRLAGRGWLIGAAMMAVCVLVPVITGQAQMAWASPDASGWGFIAIMLIGFVVQGSTEEILTRGYLTQAVARRWGLVAAVIAQAAFFALMHGMNPGMGPLPVINLALFAVFGSFMSLSEGGLWGICAMHGAWNWAQGNLFGVAVSGQQVSDSFFTFTANPGSADLITGGAFGIEGSLVCTLVYAVGIAIFWNAWKKRRSAEAAVTTAAAQPAPVSADAAATATATATATTEAATPTAEGAVSPTA